MSTGRPAEPPGRDGYAGRQRRRLTATETDLGVVRQRALLVGGGDAGLEEAEASLDELALLTDTAGAEPVAAEMQRRETPDPATFIGKGKAEELRELVEMLDIDVVIFDEELSPAQQRNLEKLFNVDVVDRVALILDIFAQHAHSQAGMLQVELAQLRYRLPRLRGRGAQMSQQGAGIGTRGPGETQLEVDRRRILRRISKLERDLAAVARTRDTQRKARRRNDHLQVALVGYTNAGKSTLLNRLTNAGVLVENRLFSTLDATVRRLALPGGETVLLSDTVGFVRKLPHQLVESFRSTLVEVVDAELLIHVVDASSAESERQIEAVRSVLRELGAGDIPELLVANKLDVADPEGLVALKALGAVPVSAVTGEGVDELLETLSDRLRSLNAVVELTVPYERGDVLAALHREGEVLVEVHDERATRVRARLPKGGVDRFAEFIAS
ncbi:MAG TPA: GTPase HflX [Acidimicrobiia bacterium]|nr:GTPase HflX [Acidimicrobiia bacterium]